MPTNSLLPSEAIEEFKILYLKSFGKSLSQTKAEKQALELFQLYEAVYGKRVKQKS